jgi:hypothetical protein
MVNVINKLPNAIIISDKKGLSYLNNTAKKILKVQNDEPPKRTGVNNIKRKGPSHSACKEEDFMAN